MDNGDLIVRARDVLPACVKQEGEVRRPDILHLALGRVVDVGLPVGRLEAGHGQPLCVETLGT